MIDDFDAGPIDWSEFYDPSEVIELPAWVEPSQYGQMTRDIQWERAHERAIRVGLLTALAAAADRWGDYGTHDYLPHVLEELRHELYPRAVREKPATKSLRRPIPARRRQEVMERDAYRCRHCDSHINLVIDHVHPVSLGGTNDIENLQTLCHDCNTEKGTKTMEELGW